MVVWANLHPSFTFGLALLYVFVGYSCYEKLLRREYRTMQVDELSAVIAVTVCALLLTPYGIFSTLLTLQAMNMKYALKHVASRGTHQTFNKTKFTYFSSSAF